MATGIPGWHIAGSKECMVPWTIDDPGVIPEITGLLRSKKLVKQQRDSGNRAGLPDISQI
jgi:hypothetical protein